MTAVRALDPSRWMYEPAPGSTVPGLSCPSGDGLRGTRRGMMRVRAHFSCLRLNSREERRSETAAPPLPGCFARGSKSQMGPRTKSRSCSQICGISSGSFPFPPSGILCFSPLYSSMSMSTSRGPQRYLRSMVCRCEFRMSGLGFRV